MSTPGFLYPFPSDSHALTVKILCVNCWSLVVYLHIIHCVCFENKKLSAQFNISITLIPGNLIHWTISDQKLGISHKIRLSHTMIVWFWSGIILTSPILLYIPSTNSIMQQTHTWHFICYNLFASGWEYSRKQLFNPLLVWNSSHLAPFGVKIHESTVITSKFRPCWQSIWNFHWFVWIPVINMRSQSY